MTSPSIVHNSDVGAIQETRVRELCRLKTGHPRNARFLRSEFGQLLCKLCCQRARLAVTPDARQAGLRDGSDKPKARRLSPHDLALKGVTFWIINKRKARTGCHCSTLAKNNRARSQYACAGGPFKFNIAGDRILNLRICRALAGNLLEKILLLGPGSAFPDSVRAN